MSGNFMDVITTRLSLVPNSINLCLHFNHAELRSPYPINLPLIVSILSPFFTDMPAFFLNLENIQTASSIRLYQDSSHILQHHHSLQPCF